MKLTTYLHPIYNNLPKARLFNAILIDPPWEYDDRINDHSRGAINHYPTLTLEQIAAFPINDYVHEETFLYLWATKDFRVEAERLIKGFGFTFKTEFIWIKIKRNSKDEEPDDITEKDLGIGMGHYNRLVHEYLLFAIKGESTNRPKLATTERSVFFSPIPEGARKKKHSSKPDIAYQIIERNVDPPYLEIFARKSRPNWISWGNELVELVA